MRDCLEISSCCQSEQLGTAGQLLGTRATVIAECQTGDPGQLDALKQTQQSKHCYVKKKKNPLKFVIAPSPQATADPKSNELHWSSSKSIDIKNASWPRLQNPRSDLHLISPLAGSAVPRALGQRRVQLPPRGIGDPLAPEPIPTTRRENKSAFSTGLASRYGAGISPKEQQAPGADKRSRGSEKTSGEPRAGRATSATVATGARRPRAAGRWRWRTAQRARPRCPRAPGAAGSGPAPPAPQRRVTAAVPRLPPPSEHG